MASIPDIVPITDLRQDASGVNKRASETQQQVFITLHGRAAAVVVSAKACECMQHELEVPRQLARGEAEIEAGEGHALADVLAEADDLLGRP